MNLFTDIPYTDINNQVTILLKYPDYLLVTPNEAVRLIADKISEDGFFMKTMNTEALSFFLRHRSSFFVISLAREIENRLTIPNEVNKQMIKLIKDFHNGGYITIEGLLSIYKEELTQPILNFSSDEITKENRLLEMARALNEIPSYAIRKMVDDLPSSTYRAFIDEIIAKSKLANHRELITSSAEVVANCVFVTFASDFSNRFDNQKTLTELVSKSSHLFSKVAELYDLYFFTMRNLNLRKDERLDSELISASCTIDIIKEFLTDSKKDTTKMSNFEPKVAATLPETEKVKSSEISRVAKLPIELITDPDLFEAERAATLAAINFLFSFRDGVPNTADTLGAVIKVINSDSASGKVYLCNAFAANGDILSEEDRKAAYSVLLPWLTLIEDKETKLILSEFIDKQIFA